jgi:hypothetical protein
MSLSNYIENIWILNNSFYNIGGNALQIGGANPQLETTNHIYVGENTISKTRQSSIGIKKSSDVIISKNNLSDTRETYNGTGSNFCAGISYQYAPQRLWLINNIIHDADHGIKSGSSTTPKGDYIYILGNVIYAISHPGSGDNTTGWDEGAAIRAHGVTHAYVIGNTIYDADIGIETPDGAQYLYIENNIVSEILYDHIRIEFVNTASSGSLLNNLFYQLTGETLKIGANKYTVATYPYGSGNINTNPLHVNTDLHNFRLQNNSPAIDTGIASTVYTTFYSTYGISIERDNDNITRPSGNKWDIGAYEYVDNPILPSPIFKNVNPPK